ncbi:M23 family metallopeptidase [Aquimarina rhabdastrellae]
MRTLIFLLVFIPYWSVFSQSKIPVNDFKNPLDISLVLSGTFGELRSNHFHSGLDIKTQQRQGLKVYASATGYVSRIKISHFGYGKALYVKHPNGYTTVYAHLKKFSPEIEAYVKKRQYAKESYEIELFPKSSDLKVTQGTVIAYSGNSGGSGGPHLHFEIRDGASRPMNPMQFGIDIKDTKKPIIGAIWGYSLSDSAHINQNQKPQKLRLIPQKDGTYKTAPIKACGRIGFGIVTSDQQDLAYNKNGIYTITTDINGEKNFELNMKRFSFSETRYINRMIDYSFFKRYKSRITKLFVQENNPLSIYSNTVDDGIITVADSLSYTICVTVKDYKGNTTLVKIPIQGESPKNLIKEKVEKTNYWARADQNFVYNEGIVDVFIPKGSLYDNEYLNISTTGETLKLHNNRTPLHKNITIAFDVSKYSAKHKKQLYIARLGFKKEPLYSKTKKRANRFTTHTRNFGTYSLFVDSIPPIIKPINVTPKKWMSKSKTLKVKIDDSDSGIKSYRATINGKFILMEYDYKTGLLVYDFNDKIIAESENNFKLIVLDNVGNNSTFETTFFRKQ